MIHYIDELSRDELRGKKVLLRVDFNVPLDHGQITETFRIVKAKQTIDFLIGAGARVALCAHLADDKSFEPLVDQIGSLLGRDIFYTDSIGADAASLLDEYDCVLIENVRFHDGEEQNDDHFAEQFAKGFDIYVSDAFGAVHREHASLVAITKHLKSYAGFLLRDEIKHLSLILEAPKEGKTLILGGAKASTKLPVIENFLDRAEHILVGGVLANVLVAKEGIAIGRSRTEDVEVTFDPHRVTLPDDFVVSKDNTGNQESYTVDRGEGAPPEAMILDIGPMTIERFIGVIQKSSLVVWNGPVGLSEVEIFARGTQAITKAILDVPTSVVGGGDTLAAVPDLLEKFSFVSTGGGAMLAFLAGRALPGLIAIGYEV